MVLIRPSGYQPSVLDLREKQGTKYKNPRWPPSTGSGHANLWRNSVWSRIMTNRLLLGKEKWKIFPGLPGQTEMRTWPPARQASKALSVSSDRGSWLGLCPWLAS